MSYSVSTLLIRNLHDVFGENDPVRRRAAINEIFNEECVFYDPKGSAYRGRDEINRIAGVIKATHPDFQYQPIWIRSGRKMRIRYRNQEMQESERTISPVILGYAETVRLLIAWCELRQGFRHFRTDRVFAAEFLDEHYGCGVSDLRNRWKTRYRDGARSTRFIRAGPDKDIRTHHCTFRPR
jgi:hypothetical protein